MTRVRLPSKDKRNRIIFTIPPDVQMAIRLRAVKTGATTGDVVADAVRRAFPKECQEAYAEMTRKPA